MAENKTINIKINSNTKEATKDTKDYNKAIGSTKKQYDAVLKSGDSYEKQLSDINKIVKETPLNVRDMNKQIQAYQSIALSAGRETPVGKEALQKASELRDRYIDIQNETKRLADDQKNLQGALQLVGTGVAAFGGVQSAMALTGVESEKLRETLVKLQAAQTLMNSINQIATALEKESSAMLLLKSSRTKILTLATYGLATANGVATKGLKLFRLALISTGIGALVVGVGLLIANFDKVKKVLSNVNKGFKEGGLLTKALMIAFMPLIATVKAFQKGYEGITEALGITNKALDAQAIKQQEVLDKIKATNEARKKELELEKRYNEDTIKNLELDKALANSTEEKIAINKKLLQTKLDNIQTEQDAFLGDQKVKLATNEKLEKDLYAQYVKYNGKRIGREEKTAQRYYQTYLDQVKINRDFNKQINDGNFQSFVEFNTQRRALRDAYNKENDDLRKGDIDKDKETQKTKNTNYKNYLQERLNAARKIEDLENSLMEDGIEKDLEINRDKFRRLREDAKKNTKLTAKERKELNDLYTEQQEQSEAKIREKYDQKEIDDQLKLQEEFDKIRRQNEDDLRTDEENELLKVAEKYDVLQAQAQGNAEALNDIEIARLNAENEIKLQYANEAYEAQKAIDDKAEADQKVRDDKAKADAKALQDYKISVVQGGLSAINDIAALFAKGNEKQQKRAFQVQKAVGIAQATINTAQAITKVFAETTDFTPTQSLRIANAVGIGIAGAAQIASIASQQFTGGGDVESPTDIGGAGGGEAVAPSFNVVGDSGINQIAQLQQTPVQAFVVSGEVTTSQALDRNRVQNATL